MTFLKIINKIFLYCYAIFINCYELLFKTLGHLDRGH
eukprot:SAG11_NODE_6275_length_1345_cov_6.332263_2_plen_36_part_01